MPKTKGQGICFGIIMSYAMAYGMEVYNVAIKEGYNTQPGGFSNMGNGVFLDALIETLYMGVLVFLFSNLWGNRLGGYLAGKCCDPQQNSALVCQLVHQGCTVAVMCPTMSLVASILFNVILAGNPWTQLPAIWVGTLLKNFPMALCWNVFAAAPFTRWLFQLIFVRKKETA